MGKNAGGAGGRAAARGGGATAPASGGNPLSPAATVAERAVAAGINRLIRDPRLAPARAAEIERKIEQRVQRLEVEKRRIIHDAQGRVRALDAAEKARVAAINRSLDRANAQSRALRNAVANIQRRQRRGG